MSFYTVNISRIHVVKSIVHRKRIHLARQTWSESSSTQLSYSIRYVAVLSWQMEEGSKHREHRSYLEESHHAAIYIADDFGMMAASTEQELAWGAESGGSVKTRTWIGHILLWDLDLRDADWWVQNVPNGTRFQYQQKLWAMNIRCWFETGCWLVERLLYVVSAERRRRS